MPLTPEQRARRVAILCCHTLRNIALYRAWWPARGSIYRKQFWSSVHGNFIDIAVLEWCKLFGEYDGKHHFRRVIKHPRAFAADMFDKIGVRREQFHAYIKDVKEYRDSFVAHLDDELTMIPPVLDIAKDSTAFLYMRLREQEQDTGVLDDAPPSATEFFAEWTMIGRNNYRAWANSDSMGA